MTMKHTRRTVLAGIAGGAVVVAAPATTGSSEFDPTVDIAAEWQDANAALEAMLHHPGTRGDGEWTSYVLRLCDAGYRLTQAKATTLAGAAAILGVAAAATNPEGRLAIMHSNLLRSQTLNAWLTNAQRGLKAGVA